MFVGHCICSFSHHDWFVISQAKYYYFGHGQSLLWRSWSVSFGLQTETLESKSLWWCSFSIVYQLHAAKKHHMSLYCPDLNSWKTAFVFYTTYVSQAPLFTPERTTYLEIWTISLTLDLRSSGFWKTNHNLTVSLSFLDMGYDYTRQSAKMSWTNVSLCEQTSLQRKGSSVVNNFFYGFTDLHMNTTRGTFSLYDFLVNGLMLAFKHYQSSKQTNHHQCNSQVIKEESILWNNLTVGVATNCAC